MRYALLIYCGEDTTDCHGESMNPKHQTTAPPSRPQAPDGLADSLRLLPARTARVVRCWDGGDVIIRHGPATQTSEHLTGWVIAECTDLDAAVRLATTIPAAWYGSVEVRPVSETPT
jgi:hypothetical protein